MHPDLRAPHRLLARAYTAYVRADHDWRRAAEAAATWFPEPMPPQIPALGDPGSRVRRLYDRRERALIQIHAARAKLEAARLRLERRRATVTILIGAP